MDKPRNTGGAQQTAGAVAALTSKRRSLGRGAGAPKFELLLAALCLTACSGQLDSSSLGAPGSGAATSPAVQTPSVAGNPTSGSVVPVASVALPVAQDPGACVANDPGESVLHRLSRVEYQLTLKELFQLKDVPAVESLPEDSDFKGFRTLSALQSVTTEHLRAYQKESDALVKTLWTDTARRKAVLGCEPEAKECLKDFVTRFGRLAYRRSLAATEVDELQTLAASGGTTSEAQYGTAIAGILSSPSFLFRVEVGNKTEGLSTLTGVEVASKLAFTLTGRAPSASLLTRGEQGQLDTEAGVQAAAKELLSDPRSREYFGSFFKQWLGYEQLRAPKAPPAGWNNALLLSMQEETDRVIDEFAWGKGANFLEALTANHSYLRADLAEFYGLGAPAADGYVEIPKGHFRENSGLLSHAALLSQKRDGDRIAHRGAWVQRTFLCFDLQVPTALLDSVSDELAGLTYQQIVDRRNSDKACAGCHAQIDPIGVGLAAYDDIAHFDPKFDVKQFGIASKLPGSGDFESVGGLAQLLKQRSEIVNCMSAKAFLYTAGREPLSQDQCTVAQAAKKFGESKQQFSQLLEGLVTRPDFRLRRAPQADATQMVTPEKKP